MTDPPGGRAGADAALELGVLVDDEDGVIGSAPRQEIRVRNLLHRGVAIIVRNSKGQIYVHRRTETKDVFPGMYDASVGGMVEAGEGYGEAAARELGEELGISGAEPQELFMHRYRGDANNAWMAVFEVVWDGSIRHQEEEIDWGAWMDPDEVMARHEDWPFAPDHRELIERYLAERGYRSAK